MFWIITCNGWPAGNIAGRSRIYKNSINGLLARNVRICKLNMREVALQRHMRLWMCETGMANTGDTSSSQNKWNCSLMSPLKHRNCNTLVVLRKLVYTYTWTHAEPLQFSVFKIIPKWCNFTVCNSIFLSWDSIVKEYCSSCLLL